MTQTQRPELILVGCGAVFETLKHSWAEQRSLRVYALASTDGAADAAALLLSDVDVGGAKVFVAVDGNALNYARLEVYGRLRLLGFKCDTLIHSSAIVDRSARIGENCWIGAGAIIGPGVRVGHNTFIGAATRVEFGATIGSNTWLGAGAAIGRAASVGTHTVIGDSVHIGGLVSVGRHCVVDVPGHYAASLVDGTFIDALFPVAARIYAPGRPAPKSATAISGNLPKGRAA